MCICCISLINQSLSVQHRMYIVQRRVRGHLLTSQSYSIEVRPVPAGVEGCL